MLQKNFALLQVITAHQSGDSSNSAGGGEETPKQAGVNAVQISASQGRLTILRHAYDRLNAVCRLPLHSSLKPFII